jgi:hypothetical protein
VTEGNDGGEGDGEGDDDGSALALALTLAAEPSPSRVLALLGGNRKQQASKLSSAHPIRQLPLPSTSERTRRTS